MPFNTIQSKSGSFDGASGSATLDAATTAGSLIIIVAGYGSPGTGSPAYDIATPSEFTLISGANSSTTTRKAVPKVWAKRNSAGGESSWTLTMTTAGQVVWRVYEVEGAGLDPLNEWFVTSPTSAPAYNGSDPTSQSTGTSPVSSCYEVLAIAVHAARSNDTTIPTWSGQTNGYFEDAEVSHVNANNALSMVVSLKQSWDLEQFECTAALSPGSPATGCVVAIYADGEQGTGIGAKQAPNFDAMYGAEIGTVSGLGAGSTGIATKQFDTVVGTPVVSTSNPRVRSDGVGGAYCLELSSVAAAEYVEWTSSGVLGVYTPTTGYPVPLRLHLRFPTLLPLVDTELFSIDAGSTGTLTIWFRAASSKLGVKVGTGTEVVSDAVVAADKWVGLDVRYDPRVTAHLCDWQVDYDSLDATGPVAQTQAVGAGTSITDITAVRFGWHNARTATVQYDDIALGKSWGMYPIGDISILPLGPDPAGTATISGTAANFKTFVSNGTMSAWDGAVAITRLDEVPPIVGASADGIANVTSAIGEYAEIPMATWTAAPDYVPRALRWYVAGWAASTQPAEIEMRSYDGVAELSLTGAGDHGFDN